MAPELMETWLRDFDGGEAPCGGSCFDPAAICAAAAEEFPAMRSFSQCLLQRFSTMCQENRSAE